MFQLFQRPTCPLLRDSSDAIYKFKRYEDASLTYVGINRHANKAIGLYNTVI